VRRRIDRVAMNLPVELIVVETVGKGPDGSAGGAGGRAPRGLDGKRLRAVSQDISPYGVFVRLSSPLPVGTVVQLVLSPNGERLITTGKVSHALGEIEARTLGRFPGVGIAFRRPIRPADHEFVAAISRLLEHHAQHRPPAETRIVVADAETRILERLSTALGTAGFSVATATNGMEAIGACLSRTPDVVLVERDMPVVDGLHVLAEMGRHSELASVPVMMMSADATDLIRLQAFQLGAADFIPKPFTVLEVILRARRWARASQRDPERIVLRGALAELGLPSLLTMFEQERKSGQLALTRDQLVAWIDFVDGRIVRARSTEVDADTRTVLMHALDWQAGYFELSAGAPAAPADPGDSLTVTHLLLEHARRRDERARTTASR
jgi:DNA-binding response OmpR family regulator